MSLSSVDRRVRENTSAVYTATLKDQDGTVIAAGSLDVLTLTLYNDKDGTIINSRSEQDVLNANNVTVDSSGGLIWVVQPADNVIVDTSLVPGQIETHYALFAWTWDSSAKQGSHGVQIDVLQVDEVTLSAGPTIISSWGGGTSNSYVALTAANSFIVNCVLDHSAWDSASSDQRCAALMEAVRDIDARQYFYTKYLSTQILEFPRAIGLSWSDSIGAWDPTNLSTTETRMQRDVEQACCHQALFLLQQQAKSAHATLRDVGVTNVKRKVGPVEEEFRYASPTEDAGRPGGGKRPLCMESLQLLSDWITSKRIYRA